MFPTPLRRRARTAASLAVVAATAVTVALFAASHSAAAPDEQVFTENFDAVADGELPDGFFAASGEWSVQDGELIGHMADSFAPAVVTFGDQHMDDYRVEFDMRFVATNDGGRWAGVVTDIAPTGTAPWWQAVIRENGSTVEFAQRTATNTWNVTNSSSAPAPGIGNDVSVRVDVHGRNGEWYLNDQLVLTTSVMDRSGDGVLGFSLTGGTVAYDNLVVTELAPLPEPEPEPEPELFHYEEHFDGDALPEGWNPVVGQWSVRDGRLHLDEPVAIGRITFGPHLDHYEVSATIRFESVNNSSRWAGIMLDAPVDGASPWAHAVMRSQSTAANGIEFARRTASNTWSVTDAAAAPADAGVGTDVAVRIVVQGSRGEWYFDDQLVLSTNSIERTPDGGLGFVADGARISVGDLVVRELPVERRSFVREPGQGPITIAHRGYSGIAPENTLAAFEASIRTGAEMFEIDTYTTAEGSNVVIHDGTLDRTTDGTGSVTGATDEYLRSLDAGSWFSPAYAGQPVPFFEDVLDLARGRGSMVLWEIKQINQQALAEGVEQIRARGMEDQVMIQSFNATHVAWARDIAPEIPRAYLTAPGSNPLALAEDLELSAWNMSNGWIRDNPGFVDEMHAIGVAVMPYTVNDPNLWRELAEIGVDGIITDRAHQHIGFRQGSPIEVTIVDPGPQEPPEPEPIAVRVEQATGQADPTAEQPVLFDLAFAAPVLGFDAAHVVVGGTAGATDVIVTEVTPGIRYRVAVSGALDSGTVTVSVAEGAATDAAGTATAASTSTDNEVTIELPGPLAACTVDYMVESTWPGGFNAAVTLTNDGDAALVGWQVGWTFAGGEQVRNGWSGEYTQDAADVTVTNLSWNRIVHPGDSVSVGFTGGWDSALPSVPAVFTLDGVPCAG